VRGSRFKVQEFMVQGFYYIDIRRKGDQSKAEENPNKTIDIHNEYGAEG